MTKEKQIEEMAKIFCGMKNDCDSCMWDKTHCYERIDAEEIYNAGYRKQSEGEWKKTFYVIDNKTGKEADCEEIALTEEWAKELIYCDMEGFALGDDGTLFLLDECGSFEYCPNDRFTVVFEKGGGEE